MISYPSTDVFLIIFDVTQSASFENAIKKVLNKFFSSLKIILEIILI